VTRLTRMNEEGRGAGACQRGCDLAADVPDLPMPVTTIRPRQSRQILQARANSAPSGHLGSQAVDLYAKGLTPRSTSASS